MTSSDQKRMMRMTASYLVEQLMHLMNRTRDEALLILMRTVVYETLMNPETELFLESRESILDYLKEELAGNPLKLLEK